MESKILLGKILQRFCDRKFAIVDGYNSFGYIRETDKVVYVTRESGEDTPVSYERLLKGIEAYKSNPALYDSGPTTLLKFEITHVTIPVWSILRLLNKKEYE